MSTYTPNIADTGFPPKFINAYVLAQMQEFGLLGQIELLEPMVPAQVPINIEDLYNDEIVIRQQTAPIFFVYDRLTRFRPTPFYRHKREQLVYFIYNTEVDKLIDATRILHDALDREDAAAQDVNSWCRKNMPGCNIFFHNIKVYQADESRDVAELASARTLFVNKIIIEYDYHTVTPADYKYN